jgi:GNAT superfamily N-acetyltransferase
MTESGFGVRIASADDLDALRLALAYAIEWRSAMLGATAEDLIRDTGHCYLLEGWGRAGDVAVVAEVGHRAVGAAWYRFWDDSVHSYGYVDSVTPELGVGVDPAFRGRGVGTALLAALIDVATDRGVRRLSLSVEGENPAMCLYVWLGFVRLAPLDASWTMVKELHNSRPA